MKRIPDFHEEMDRLQKHIPSSVGHDLNRLRGKRAIWMRVVSGVALIVAWCFLPLPIVGIWMLPVGLALLAHDIPTPINGRRTIARVTNLFRITAMSAYQHAGTETLELNPVMVRFVWRHAAYPTGWSRMRKQLLLEEFVLAAEKEVACT